MEARGSVRRFVDGAANLFDWVNRIWPLVAAFFVGGGVMAYLTAATDWLNQIGPIAWGVAFFAGGFVSVGIYVVLLLAARVRMANKYAERGLKNTGANRLKKRFEHEQIRLADFFHPYYIPYKQVQFHGCSLIGPAALLLDGCTMIGVTFKQVQIVIIKPNVHLFGVTAFDQCIINDGELCNVTLYMNAGTYKRMAKETPDMAQHVPVISDTPAS